MSRLWALELIALGTAGLLCTAAQAGRGPRTEATDAASSSRSGGSRQAKDATEEGQRPRALGEAKRLEGVFRMKRSIRTPLEIGTKEWPVVLMLHRVEFRRKRGELRAVLDVNTYSWPPSCWRPSGSHLRTGLLDQ